MTDQQRGATKFPIYSERAEFDEFLARKNQRDLFGAHERDALRCAQPFALREEAAALGVALATSPADEYRINELARLKALNDLDKHRRLPLLAWYVDIPYFTQMVPECRLNVRMHAPVQDGDLIGHVIFQDGDPDPSQHLKIEMRMTLADDPSGYATDFLDSLTSWHAYLTGWILPRIFTVAEGNPPPIVIMH
jgi:hypothetical protein